MNRDHILSKDKPYPSVGDISLTPKKTSVDKTDPTDLTNKSESLESSDKMSLEFQRIVRDLTALKIRGEVAIQNSVALIHEYQKKFGNTKEKLEILAKAVGVTTRTFYRWIKQVENPTPKRTEKTKKTDEEIFAAKLNALIPKFHDNGSYPRIKATKSGYTATFSNVDRDEVLEIIKSGMSSEALNRFYTALLRK